MRPAADLAPEEREAVLRVVLHGGLGDQHPAAAALLGAAPEARARPAPRRPGAAGAPSPTRSSPTCRCSSTWPGWASAPCEDEPALRRSAREGAGLHPRGRRRARWPRRGGSWPASSRAGGRWRSGGRWSSRPRPTTTPSSRWSATPTPPAGRCPDLPLPPRFAHPEDARWQVREALREPRPPLRRAAGRDVAGRGVRLARGAGGAGLGGGALGGQRRGGAAPLAARRGPPGSARSTGPGAWTPAPGGELSMLFRDRSLSDLIGFTYAKVAAQARGRRTSPPTCGRWGRPGRRERPARPGHGGRLPRRRERLGALPELGARLPRRGSTAALEASAEIETVTMSEAVAERRQGPPSAASTRGPGSRRSYRISDRPRRGPAGLDRAGPGARRRSRRRRRPAQVEPERLERARRHLYAAEGSDWFWWYGEDFTTELAAEFDGLFRGHVIRASLLAGANPPAEALTPIKRLEGAQTAGIEAKPLREPTLLLTPTLDGRETDLLRVAGLGPLPAGPASRLDVRRGPGFNVLRYGFDLEVLYLRLDPAESPARRPRSRRHLKVELLAPGGQSWVDFELVPDGRVRAGRRQRRARARSPSTPWRAADPLRRRWGSRRGPRWRCASTRSARRGRGGAAAALRVRRLPDPRPGLRPAQLAGVKGAAGRRSCILRRTDGRGEHTGADPPSRPSPASPASRTASRSRWPSRWWWCRGRPPAPAWRWSARW